MSADTTTATAVTVLPSYSSHVPYNARPAPRLSRRIDTRKLKTKMCAYVLRGKRCPYGDNCAFAHEAKAAPELLTSPMSQRTLQSITSEESLASDDSRGRSGDDEEDAVTIVSPTRATPAAAADGATAFLPPPPSYDDAVGANGDANGLVPPSYPTRYRYDPYSYEGMMFVE